MYVLACMLQEIVYEHVYLYVYSFRLVQDVFIGISSTQGSRRAKGQI